MAELRIPEPSEKQCLFMADKHKYIGYGGARERARTLRKIWGAEENVQLRRENDAFIPSVACGDSSP